MTDGNNVFVDNNADDDEGTVGDDDEKQFSGGEGVQQGSFHPDTT